MVQGVAVKRAAGAARPGQDGHRPIDMVHLAKQTLGDQGLEQEVLRLFDQMARTYLERLRSSADVEQMLRHLHTLKGAAAGVGAARIAELARAAEADLKAGLPVCPERIDDIGMAVEECSAFIDELLAYEAA